jgi:hypothetical protein
MSSALLALANATATFDVVDVGTVEDPVTGNIIPAVEQITVAMFLREGGRSGSNFPGSDTDQLTMEGYAVNPQALDARIQAGVTGSLVFGGRPAARCEVLQERYPYGTTGLIGSTLQRVIGDRIRLAVYING